MDRIVYDTIIETGLQNGAILYGQGYTLARMIETTEKHFCGVWGLTIANVTQVMAKKGVYTAHKNTVFYTIPPDVYPSLVQEVRKTGLMQSTDNDIIIFICLDEKYELPDIFPSLTKKNILIGSY